MLKKCQIILLTIVLVLAGMAAPVFIILIAGGVAGTSKTAKRISNESEYFKAVFDSYANETEHKAVFCDYGTVFIEGQEISLFEIVKKYDGEYSGNDIFPCPVLIQGTKMWFVYSDRGYWFLSSYDLNGKKYDELGQFESEEDYLGYYQQEEQKEYRERSVYYCQGRIVVTDHADLMEYDVDEGRITHYKYPEYDFPEPGVIEPAKSKEQYSKQQTSLVFTNGEEEKLFKAGNEGEDNKVMKLLRLLERENCSSVVLPEVDKKKPNFTGHAAFHFFDTVTIRSAVIDDVPLIQAVCYDWNGRYWLFLFSYDFETNGCRYVGYYGPTFHGVSGIKPVAVR